MYHRFRTRATGQHLLLCTVLLCIAAAGAYAQLPSPVSISQDYQSTSDPMDEVLIALAASYGVNIVAPGSLVAGKEAAATSGNMTVTQALSGVLAGSDLIARETTAGTFVIEKALDSSQPASDLTESANPPRRPMEFVTVTGEKIDRNLQDTYASVVVLTERTLQDNVILDLEAAMQWVPNVTITPDGAGLSIRGIPQQGLGNGTFDPVAPTSAIYIDGAVQTQAAVSNGALSTWDVQQVEVFRGPQTATQGRAGLAGAVIVNTVDPDQQWSARTRLLASDENQEQVSFAAGGPLVEDRLAFRVAAETVKDDGYTKFNFDDQRVDNPGINDRDFLRAKLLWTPHPTFDAMLTYTYAKSKRGSNVVNGPDFFDANTTEIINESEGDLHTGSLVMTYRASDAITLTSATAFSDLDVSDKPVPATLGGTGLAVPADGDDSTFSQELRLVYDAGGSSRGIAGVYYADVEENFERTILGNVLGSQFSRNDGYERSYKNTAAFGQFEYDISSRLTLAAGGRYEYEERNYINFEVTEVEPDSPFLPDSESRFEGSGNESAWLPKLGLTYNFNDSVSLNATYQQAYRPGGTSNDPRDGSEVQFDPEFSDNYDLALRSLLLDERLFVNVNLYYVDYDDLQIRVSPDPNIPVIRFVDNAGKAEYYGLELSSQLTVNESWTFNFAAAWQESELKEFETGGIDASGDELPYSPNFSGSIGATWQHEKGWTASMDIAYSGDYFSNIPTDNDTKVSEHTIVNGRVGYRSERWGVYLYTKNLFDENYVVSANRVNDDPALWTASLGRPRTLGLILEASY
ncbi:MAG: TonB-dependent receptor [Pseudomonadota bacterium]